MKFVEKETRLVEHLRLLTNANDEMKTQLYDV